MPCIETRKFLEQRRIAGQHCRLTRPRSDTRRPDKTMRKGRRLATGPTHTWASEGLCKCFLALDLCYQYQSRRHPERPRWTTDISRVHNCRSNQGHPPCSEIFQKHITFFVRRRTGGSLSFIPWSGPGGTVRKENVQHQIKGKRLQAYPLFGVLSASSSNSSNSKGDCKASSPMLSVIFDREAVFADDGQSGVDALTRIQDQDL